VTDVGAEPAPAKINLCLHVTGRRDDGYHLLSSLVAFADLHDTLVYAPDRALRLTLAGPQAGSLSAEPDNLVLRAARALAAAHGIEPTGRLTLIKRLPVASGIGGGSADAAAAIRLLTRMWRLDPPVREIADLVLGLGADVPMCLTGRPALAEGIGDALVPVPELPPLDLVLVNPRRPVATADVFRTRTGEFGDAIGTVPHGGRAVLVDWLCGRRNDLQSAACTLEPAVRAVLDILSAQTGCRLVRMSGSGATCFGIFDDREAAVLAATRVGWRVPSWWVAACRTLADGEILDARTD
jgi:4-diphosphocytidyl-2-C-methyl-D-erythritol kinase